MSTKAKLVFGYVHAEMVLETIVNDSFIDFSRTERRVIGRNEDGRDRSLLGLGKVIVMPLFHMSGKMPFCR